VGRMLPSAFRFVSVSTFIAFVSITACSPPAEETAQPAVETEDLYSNSLSEITRENLQGHLNFLASDARAGRMTGTGGYDESAAYVAQQFQLLGLTPGGDEGWYQNVPML